MRIIITSNDHDKKRYPFFHMKKETKDVFFDEKCQVFKIYDFVYIISSPDTGGRFPFITNEFELSDFLNIVKKSFPDEHELYCIIHAKDIGLNKTDSYGKIDGVDYLLYDHSNNYLLNLFKQSLNEKEILKIVRGFFEFKYYPIQDEVQKIIKMIDDEELLDLKVLKQNLFALKANSQFVKELFENISNDENITDASNLADTLDSLCKRNLFKY